MDLVGSKIISSIKAAVNYLFLLFNNFNILK